MSRTLAPRHHRALWLIVPLGLAVALYLGYYLGLAGGQEDIGHLETTLALSISGQLQRGFGSLYGPFTGENPLVLIHAPLYYRVAALGAWVIAALGLDPLTAALAAGRLVSILATFCLLLATARLARLDGPPRWSGTIAWGLVAASPVLASLAVMVRPDVAAVCLQTIGAVLVLRTLQDGATRRLGAAYVVFALAICAKQHQVIAPTVSSGLLVAAWLRGKVRLGSVLAAHGLGLAVGAAYLWGEDWLTGGRMSHAVFVLPGGPFREINYATWGHVQFVVGTTAKKSVGLIALAAACGWTWRRVRPLDVALVLFLVAELAALVPLCLFNQGAADNYALQAVVFAAALVGRAVARLLDEATIPWRRLAPLAAAAVLVLARDVQLVELNARQHRHDRADLAALFRLPDAADLPAHEFYFARHPAHNRTRGHVALAHDEWLYGAFETVRAAEPRSDWLRPALESGPVRRVVVPNDTNELPGLLDTLPELGYRVVGRSGPYVLWRRDGGSHLAARAD